MQLAIDIGNTRVKAGIFDQENLRETSVFNDMEELLQSDIIALHDIRRCIVGTVVDGLEPFISRLSAQTDVLFFRNDTPVPLTNLYLSAHTLGSDRMAAAVAGSSLAPGQNVLVIDAGTCIKYNFVTAANEYLGGAISPGLQMRFKALNTFTSRLPLLKPDPELNTYIGRTSAESILAGVQYGALKEVDGFIDEYRAGFNNLKVFLTGGDTDFFAKRLKNGIFADPNLILKGLNRILSHNE